jgi:hypothetical protein
MTLQAITDDGYLHWRCVMLSALDGELLSCGELKTCHIDEVVYVQPDPGSARGPTIALPRCQCGAQLFLKADYSIKELWHETLIFVEDETDRVYAYALPLRYMLNLRVHAALYERGKAAYGPVLDMPPLALLEYPQWAGVKPQTIYALWFGFAVARQFVPALSGIDLPLLLPPAH